MYEINHLHLRSHHPRETAEWFVKAFDFEIFRDFVRPFGDHFIRCRSAGGFHVNISGPRSGETLAAGMTATYVGLEHFGVTVASLEAEIARLTALGAELAVAPHVVDPGVRVCFLLAPGKIRIEMMELFDA